MIFNGKQLTVFGHMTDDFKEKKELTVEFTENGEQHIAAPEDTVFTAVHAKVNVPVGVDTSDATATADDIAQGKTAYVNGEKVTGAVADIRNKPFDISIGDSEMVEGENGLNLAFDVDDVPAVFDNKTQFLLPAADIAKTAGLTADIIAEGNTVLGITGTFAGGGASDEDVEALNDVLDAINGEIVGETQYKVTFLDEDGTFLCEVPVYEGDNCDDPVKNKTIDAPAKGGTKYIGYRHSGWSKVSGGAADSTALQNVTANRTVYAAFEEYEITLASGDVSRTSSDSVRWKINPDYVLTLYGTGRTVEYDSVSEIYPPWYSYRDKITTVVVESGVTELGGWCFREHTALTTVSIAEGLRNIGVRTFHNCTALTTINLPQSLSFIGVSAFSGCAQLTSITIPSGVNCISSGAFNHVTSAIFEKTTGWRSGNNYDTGTNIPQEDMADATAAANILRTRGTLWNYS